MIDVLTMTMADANGLLEIATRVGAATQDLGDPVQYQLFWLHEGYIEEPMGTPRQNGKQVGFFLPASLLGEMVPGWNMPIKDMSGETVLHLIVKD